MCIRNSKTNGKQGFIVLEASLILPVFLLAMLSIICLIRIVGVEENVMHVYSHEAGRIGLEAYEDTRGEVVSETIFGGRLHHRIKIVENKRVSEIRLNDFRYLYHHKGMTDLIRANLSYKVNIPIPMGFGRTLEFEERLVFRGFVGSYGTNQPMDFSQMELEEGGNTVYVFPRAGTKYHKSDCSVIVVYPTEILLCPQIKRNYSPCRLCRPEELPSGSKVYCFAKAGTAYHRGSCTLVDRYVVPMEKEQAVEEGYTPCKKCGGS